jgi:hypothetical protein
MLQACRSPRAGTADAVPHQVRPDDPVPGKAGHRHERLLDIPIGEVMEHQRGMSHVEGSWSEALRCIEQVQRVDLDRWRILPPRRNPIHARRPQGDSPSAGTFDG